MMYYVVLVWFQVEGACRLLSIGQYRRKSQWQNSFVAKSINARELCHVFDRLLLA